MTANIKQVIENIKKLSADEKALIAHCLISSLETRQDENVEEAWADLAEKRYAELVSGRVKPVSWEEIKNEIKSQDA
jgi:putative addiction module component (TIGR02574 family)